MYCIFCFKSSCYVNLPYLRCSLNNFNLTQNNYFYIRSISEYYSLGNIFSYFISPAPSYVYLNNSKAYTILSETLNSCKFSLNYADHMWFFFF